MTKLLQTAGLLLLFVLGAHSYGYNDDNFDGYNRISTYSTPTQDACMITLQVNTTPTAMYFNQTQQLQNNCVNSNITFNSFFANDTVGNETLVFEPIDKIPTVIDPITAAFPVEVLQRQNGTGCVYLPQVFRPDYDKYFCALRFSMIDIYLEVYGNGTDNFTYAPSWNYEYTIIPNFANRHLIDSAYNHVDVNWSFPNITANLSESCNATEGAAIQNLSSTVYITAQNLTVLGTNWTLAYSLVKRRNATEVGDYIVRLSPSNDTLFANGTGGPCWALPITFADMFNDSAYCADDGCQVTLIVDNYWPHVYGTGDVYVIHTSGIVTNYTNATNSTNGTDSNSNGTNSSAGSRNLMSMEDTFLPMSMNALATAFNVCLITLSIVYLSF